METRPSRNRARSRIDIRLPRCASDRQQRELGAFARYCVRRIERDLGEQEQWTVTIAPTAEATYTSSVTVHDGGVAHEQQCTRADGALATWDAMCRIETTLRETRGSAAAHYDEPTWMNRAG